MKLVTVEEGVRLEVLDWGGSGRPLVLLAGSGNRAHVFDDLAPKLTDSGHVYGITEAPPGPDDHPQNERERAAIAAFRSTTKGYVDRWVANLKRGVPAARLVDLPGAGHYVFLTREAEVLRELRALLAGLPGRGRAQFSK